MISDGGHDQREPIAIVGMGCRLPGGIASSREFWELLRGNRQAPLGTRWHRREPHSARGAAFAAAARRAASLGTRPEFASPGSTRTAPVLDPRQRMVLEVAWEALEDAGIPPSRLAGTDTSVFMGVCRDQAARRPLEAVPRLEAVTGIRPPGCAIADRLSYALDLRGPRVTIDAACSAALVAVHQACRSLRSGETSLALAGGVTLPPSPGSALAMLALKRLADAVRDGDRVLAVVRGSAVHQGDRGDGTAGRDDEAQARLVRQACRDAGVSASAIDYVEAHGTGYGVGDRLDGLAGTVGSDRSAGRPCLIGSVTSNIGHPAAASGAAGLIKLVLALRHGVIPATLSRIGLPMLPTPQDRASGLHLVTENTPWPRQDDRLRLAGTGNFGHGGTLVHLILEEAPVLAEADPPDRCTTGGAKLIPLRRRSKAGSRTTVVRTVSWPDEDTSLAA